MTIMNPEEWVIPFNLLLVLLGFGIPTAWVSRAAYGKVMGAIEELRRDVQALRERNSAADHDAETLRTEQRKSEVTQAVLGEAMRNVAASVARIETAVDKLGVIRETVK